MTQEQIKFCANMCMAAAMLGIRLKHDGDDEKGHVFAFQDPVVGNVMVGEAKQDKQEALFACCQRLQESLCSLN
jgi:hypothetical protein